MDIVSTTIQAGNYEVIINNLNVRSIPSSTGAILSQLSKCSIVKLDGYSKMIDGYIWGRYTNSANQTCYIAVRKTNGIEYLKQRAI